MKKQPQKKKQLKNNLDLIYQNIDKVKKSNQSVKILAVTKNHSSDKIQEAIDSGLRFFGENKVQEAVKKFTPKTKNIELHLIGHLQKNKVKKAIQVFDVIQTVDTLTLAEKINSNSKKEKKQQRIYCQINIGNDPKKFGLKKTESINIISQINKLNNTVVEGLMTILPHNLDNQEIQRLYLEMGEIHQKIKEQIPTCTELSMGMSHDFPLAIQSGSTMIRIGTKLFGERIQ